MDKREEEYITTMTESDMDLLGGAAQSLSEKHAELQALVRAANRRCHEFDSALQQLSQKLKQPTAQHDSVRENYDRLVQQRAAADQAARKLNKALVQLEHMLNFLSIQTMPADTDTINQVRILQAQEDERARLARDLHDGPAQVVSNAIFQLEGCARQVAMQPERVRETLIGLSKDLRRGMTEIRGLIANLRRPAGLDMGLGVVLRQYAYEYTNRFGIEVIHDIGALDVPMSDTVAIAVLRIVQEAFQNVQKHAGATTVYLTASVVAGMLIIQVRDNGCGFDPSRVQSRNGRHIGLSSMRERASLIDGTLDIQSAENEGTTVVLRVPASASLER